MILAWDANSTVKSYAFQGKNSQFLLIFQIQPGGKVVGRPSLEDFKTSSAQRAPRQLLLALWGSCCTFLGGG